MGADLMTVGKVEELIARLARRAPRRIHWYAATQRPSVDVITGLSKITFNPYLAFTVPADRLPHH